MKTVEINDVQEIVRRMDVDAVKGKSFLITGATGSLARYCVLSLCYIFSNELDYSGKVIVFGRNEEKAHDIYREFWDAPFFIFVKGTLETFFDIDDKVDYIIHAGCISNTSYFYTNPVEIVSSNLVGTYNLLNFAKKKQVKGFLFFSSGEVFGGKVPDDFTYLGIDPQKYENCYAISKAAGENICACFHKEYGVPVKIVRIGYTYGPHMDINDGHLYSDFAKAIIEHKTLEIRGDGQSTIGLCYVTDAVVAFFMILFRGDDNKPYSMRNYKEPHTIEEIAILLTKKVFRDRNLKYKCALSNKKRMCEKLRKPEYLCDMGWEPMVLLEDGFRRVINCIEE